MRDPIYQTATQIIFSLLYLALYSQAIWTINPTGDIDVVETILYIFTLGLFPRKLPANQSVRNQSFLSFQSP
jgi:hypothetical protein